MTKPQKQTNRKKSTISQFRKLKDKQELALMSPQSLIYIIDFLDVNRSKGRVLHMC